MDPVHFDHIPNMRNTQELLETSMDVCLDIIEAKKLEHLCPQ